MVADGGQRVLAAAAAIPVSLDPAGRFHRVVVAALRFQLEQRHHRLPFRTVGFDPTAVLPENHDVGHLVPDHFFQETVEILPQRHDVETQPYPSLSDLHLSGRPPRQVETDLHRRQHFPMEPSGGDGQQFAEAPVYQGNLPCFDHDVSIIRAPP